MLLQTNSYIVPRDRRAEHERLMRRIRQALARLGCEQYEVYEQVGANWSSSGDRAGRFVQIMRFRDRKHQVAVQAAEKNDPATQALIKEFCELINFPYQQQQGLFAIGFYQSILPATLEGWEPDRNLDQAPEEAEEHPVDTSAQESSVVEDEISDVGTADFGEGGEASEAIADHDFRDETGTDSAQDEPADADTDVRADREPRDQA
jgi:hypothetical protein